MHHRAWVTVTPQCLKACWVHSMRLHANALEPPPFSFNTGMAFLEDIFVLVFSTLFGFEPGVFFVVDFTFLGTEGGISGFDFWRLVVG